ncbi:DUF1310 family protein [Streptococcus ferus]|uniref:DUF1310 family protein n=1 Tax=Streptococcus ferus TaxID=1345 RepID=UPI0035A08617
MKKSLTRIGIGLGGLLSIGVIIIGGYWLMQKVEHDQMVNIVKSEEVKKIIETDLKEFDSEALSKKGKIKSYKINEKSIKHNPMGGIDFEIYINSDRSLKVYYGLEKNMDTGRIEYSGGGYSKEVKNLIGVGE